MFSLSPAVIVQEHDLSYVIGARVSSLACYAGKFHWGPVNQPMLTTDEPHLVQMFGKPTKYNAVDFFTLASFFAYSSGAWVTRIGNSEMKNAKIATEDDISLINDEDFKIVSGNSLFARYPGTAGNTLDIAVCSTQDQFEYIIKSDIHDIDNTSTVSLIFADAEGDTIRTKVLPFSGDASIFRRNDYIVIDNTRYRIDEIDLNGNTITIDRIYSGSKEPSEIIRSWQHSSEFPQAPADNEFHVVVIDRDAYFKRNKNTILEIFDSVSLLEDAVDDQNRKKYWKDVINNKSQFIGAGALTPVTTDKASSTYSLTGGFDSEASVGLDEYIEAYSLYLNSEVYDTPLTFSGSAFTALTAKGSVLANFLIHSLAEVRKDMEAFISPPLEAVLNNKNKEASACVNSRKFLGSSSYATMDCNWKYMYDKYNDTYWWVPCAGDHAGLYAQGDRERDPWVSNAGTTKGLMKNVVKFAWNPNKTARDLLYSNDVNPMYNMSIVGPVLMGDKTLYGKNSALSRNNVRRLLIVLEKAIATGAVNLLFEFNDEFTQRQFVSKVTPFLEDAKGRRGLSDFKVVCDGTVNTPQVVQNNAFVGEIYIKPKYSINSIKLGFKIVNASASFEESIV